MKRSNADWLKALCGTDLDRQQALSDLRKALLHNLRGALFERARTDEALIEDMVQDSLLRILERLEQFEGRSAFLTWATAIAIRVAMNELRRHRWKDVSLDELIARSHFSAEIFADQSAEPDNHLDRKAILEKMYELIRSTLTDKQRIALSAELQGVPQDEIARYFGSNRNALYKLTHDARRALKRGLSSAGYEAADVLSIFEDRE